MQSIVLGLDKIKIYESLKDTNGTYVKRQRYLFQSDSFLTTKEWGKGGNVILCDSKARSFKQFILVVVSNNISGNRTNLQTEESGLKWNEGRYFKPDCLSSYRGYLLWQRP